MSLYYENVMSKDERIRGRILEFIDVMEERERQLSLERIFTTGLTTGDLSPYGKILESGANPKVHETPK